MLKGKGLASFACLIDINYVVALHFLITAWLMSVLSDTEHAVAPPCGRSGEQPQEDMPFAQRMDDK
jgi:hypothetical protein